MGRLLLHAPNVHVGGGLVLLKELLAAQDGATLWANLDHRAKEILDLPSGTESYFVKASPVDRLKAELRLQRAARADDVILCFHGMPPLLPLAGHVVVFQQNRNYFGLTPLSEFSGKTKIRVAFERIICRAFKGNVNEYVVQTPSMRSALITWHGAKPPVRVIPFIGAMASASHDQTSVRDGFDFVYVADGEAHKNHRRLLAAWILLAEQNIFPSLALTLPPHCTALRAEFDSATVQHGLRIEQLGVLPHANILALYRHAKALVFPSMTESFGLPLLEATWANLPIVASELDYVRDVCVPADTFDPTSPVSIARAIRRFLGVAEPVARIGSASDFLAELRS